MSQTNQDQALFATLITDPAELDAAILLIESKRAFAGALAFSTFLVYSTIDAGNSLNNYPEVQIEHLETPEILHKCPFGSKVFACSLAEKEAFQQKQTLIWIDPICLLLCPPLELLLQPPVKAAFRPVHIANIGQPVDEPLNHFWKSIFLRTGFPLSDFSLESYVDGRILLPYFNSHCFSLDPSIGICGDWVCVLQEILSDSSFAQHLAITPYRIFLFQAVLSGVILSKLTQSEIRILPADYSYPYHLQKDIPAAKRAERLEDTTCFVYEEKSPHPQDLTDIQVAGHLADWLRAHIRN